MSLKSAVAQYDLKDCLLTTLMAIQTTQHSNGCFRLLCDLEKWAPFCRQPLLLLCSHFDAQTHSAVYHLLYPNNHAQHQRPSYLYLPKHFLSAFRPVGQSNSTCLAESNATDITLQSISYCRQSRADGTLLMPILNSICLILFTPTTTGIKLPQINLCSYY